MYIKNKYFFLIFFISLNICTTFSQEKKIAIYYEGEGYLQPFIETTIDSLKDKVTNRCLFKTNSLNRLILQNQVEAERKKLLQIYVNSEKTNNYLTESEKITIKEINQQIIKNDYLLTVKTNTLVELIEFQFQIFIPQASIEDDLNPSYVKLISSENLFINPKDGNYKVELKNAIQKLFKSSNNRPKAVLKYLEEIVNSGDTILIPLKTTIKLDGQQSGDIDTEKLYYNWKNVYPKKEDIQTSKKIDLKQNEKNQEIKINEHGHYKISFNVNDGIENSKDIIINIHTFDRPKKINVYDSVVFSEYNRSWGKMSHGSLEKEGRYYLLGDSVNTKKIFLTTNKINLIFSEKNINDVFNEYELKTLEGPNKDSLTFIVIKSKFNISEKRKNYYLYNKNENNFLSEPLVLTHNMDRFFVMGFSVHNSFNLIKKYRRFEENQDPETNGGEIDSTSISESVLSNKISLDFHLTKNFQVSFVAPLKTQTIYYKNYTFESPAQMTVLARYNYFPKSFSKKSFLNSGSLKFVYNNYGTKLNPNNSDFGSGYHALDSSLGIGGGLSGKLLRTNFLHLDLTLEGSTSFFLNELSDLLDFELFFGAKFRFLD